MFLGKKTLVPGVDPVGVPHALRPNKLLCMKGSYFFDYLCTILQKDEIIYVSLRLRVQNAVPAQPCVGKLGISLVLLNFLHCNFRLWFKTP